MERDDTQERTRVMASQRYGEYVRRELKARDWTPADLARRSGLPKQTVSRIINGDAPQPTALQIAGIARGFRVRPDEIFAEMGIWEPLNDARMTVPPHVAQVWADLDAISRRAADEHLRIVRIMQRDHERQQTQPDYEPRMLKAPVRDLAAIDEPDLEAHITDEQNSWDT